MRPGKWFSDESFWRDVASRTIAGVLAASVIGTLAVLWAVLSGVTPRINSDAFLRAVAISMLVYGLVSTVRFLQAVGGRFDPSLYLRVAEKDLAQVRASYRAAAWQAGLMAAVLVPMSIAVLVGVAISP